MLILVFIYLLIGVALGFYAVKKHAKAWHIRPWDKRYRAGTISTMLIMTFTWPFAADIYLDNSRAEEPETKARIDRIKELEAEIKPLTMSNREIKKKYGKNGLKEYKRRKAQGDDDDIILAALAVLALSSVSEVSADTDYSDTTSYSSNSGYSSDSSVSSSSSYESTDDSGGMLDDIGGDFF